jgi:nucleoredoxin
LLFCRVHSSSACRIFTPKLAIFFKGYRSYSAIGERLEIVFISSDEDQANFDEHFKEMPWKALPFARMSKFE